MGVFFKVVEEWTQYPLPSYDIIDVKRSSSQPKKARRRK